jgi:hypothetical protein
MDHKINDEKDIVLILQLSDLFQWQILRRKDMVNIRIFLTQNKQKKDFEFYSKSEESRCILIE